MGVILFYVTHHQKDSNCILMKHLFHSIFHPEAPIKNAVSIMMEGVVNDKTTWKDKVNLTLKIKEVNNLTLI